MKVTSLLIKIKPISEELSTIAIDGCWAGPPYTFDLVNDVILTAIHDSTVVISAEYYSSVILCVLQSSGMLIPIIWHQVLTYTDTVCRVKLLILDSDPVYIQSQMSQYLYIFGYGASSILHSLFQ